MAVDFPEAAVEAEAVAAGRLGMSGVGMFIFISGSINSGKTTTARALAKKLGADCLDVDELTERIPEFNLSTGLDAVMGLAIEEINRRVALGKSVVANYVLRQKDFERFSHEIKTKEQFVFTLAPRIEVAKSKRGNRDLNDWEIKRIQHHYDRGIASPAFGYIIDNSDIDVDGVVDEIIKIISM